MKKNYTLVLAFFLLAAAIKAQTTNDKPTFEITEMSAPQGVEGVIYQGSKHDAEIEVFVRNVSQQTIAGAFNIHCMEDGSFFDYNYLMLSNTEEDSYIEIRNLGNAYIEKVQFIMATNQSNKPSYLVCAPSIDGNEYFGDWTVKGEIFPPIGKSMTAEFISGGDICSTDYSYEIPSAIEHPVMWGGDGTVIEDFPEKVKYVRLNWGKSFAGIGNPDKGNPTNIFAIQIYTSADITVSLEDESTASADIQLLGRNLQLGESSDVTIYEITGKVAAEYHSIQDAYLDMLNAGVYIIKAKTANGVEATQKVVIR